MSVEQSVSEVFKKVLDVKPGEINPDVKLDQALGVDSTEMVEIAVGLKKALKVPIGDNELKKTHSFNDIVNIIKSKSQEGHCGPACGCGH